MKASLTWPHGVQTLTRVDLQRRTFNLLVNVEAAAFTVFVMLNWWVSLIYSLLNRNRNCKVELNSINPKNKTDMLSLIVLDSANCYCHCLHSLKHLWLSKTNYSTNNTLGRTSSKGCLSTDYRDGDLWKCKNNNKFFLASSVIIYKHRKFRTS